jgi:AcrR family transcriptional regulator
MTVPLRADAHRNRARLLAAARELFAAHGLDVPMADIARHAGVSNGTLYNRFARREDLVEAVFTDRLETLGELAATALAAADPWDGFASYLTGACELQATDRGFNQLAARGMPDTPAVRELRRAGLTAVIEVMTRAQRAGELRPDVTVDDLAFVLRGVSRTVESAPAAWRRHLALMLDGFRTAGAHPLPTLYVEAHDLVPGR